MTPHEVFERMRQRWLANPPAWLDEELADDAVLEMPFAVPGQPRRIEGAANVRAFTAAGRAAFPARFDECRTVAIHDTADPEMIVVEYELGGVVTTTGHRASAPFIGVLRVRDGKVLLWREYQDKAAIAQALTAGRAAATGPSHPSAGSA
jgi:ketosteroid isomerase-like protein